LLILKGFKLSKKFVSGDHLGDIKFVVFMDLHSAVSTYKQIATRTEDDERLLVNPTLLSGRLLSSYLSSSSLLQVLHRNELVRRKLMTEGFCSDSVSRFCALLTLYIHLVMDSL